MGDSTLDEIQTCQNIEPHSLGNSVKSQAIIKFAAVESPAQFIRLQCNTDLNMPPSNWLTNSSSTYGLHQALYHSSGFASFHMAHMFPDCLGDVDVVSDAENIKKLLKLSYAPKCTISMVVHKVGNTLLIDEFDFQKYLLRQANEDWKWIQTFFFENILSSASSDKNFCLKDKSRTALQRKNLLSKFLYHSLNPTDEYPEQTLTTSNQGAVRIKPSFPLIEPILPEANIKENVPDPKSNHVFNRNVVWTFEDIRMLIGTDMPIFGGGTRPCISLRLREMNKPINVLTGIDYWLDNLMCNVPEVVMCYHLDGIVQKYEIIKTEDLPYLENCRFSPQLIRNVAQNILAFLKAKATKAGHTYWLFKGKNDDVVKLYDLTTLCQNGNGDGKCDNPFTVPVAMLLYNLARNMKNSTENISARKAGSIKTLLDNCIKLLPKEKYPQIVASSHYILSDLHIPAGTNPKAPDFDNDGDLEDNQSLYDDDLNGDCDSPPEGKYDFNLAEEMSENVAVKNICETLKEFSSNNGREFDRPPSPLVASIEERCNIALQHICDGLDCLQYFESNEEKLTQEEKEIRRETERIHIIHEEQNPNMAKPFQPIPLPYESLTPQPKLADPGVAIPMGWTEKCPKTKRKQKGKKCRESSHEDDSSNDPPSEMVQNLLVKSLRGDSWNIHLKVLLFVKASLTYAILSEHQHKMEKLGKCLRSIFMTHYCIQLILKYTGSTETKMSVLLARAGDCYFQFAKHGEPKIDEYLQQFEEVTDVDKQVLAQIEKDIDMDSLEQLPKPVKHFEKLMTASSLCYEKALKTTDPAGVCEIMRRVGSVDNELGLKYMTWAQDLYNNYVKLVDAEKNRDANNVQDESQKSSDEITTNTIEIFDAPDFSNIPIGESSSKVFAARSHIHLLKAIAAFEEADDIPNLVLVLCNMGRYMRFRAHCELDDKPNEDKKIIRERKFYVKAFHYYQRALGVLGSKKDYPELWDLVSWEYSTATFNLAKYVQDCSSSDLSHEEVERDIVDLLQKALKLCDVDSPGPRQVLYMYRAGTIHYRLGSFYHNQFRRTEDDHAKKTSLQLCRLHYEKAAKILEGLKEVKDFLETQLERIALQEYLNESSTSSNQKLKFLQTALDFFIQSTSVISYIKSMEFQVPNEEGSMDKIQKFLELFENRLQHILKTLAKICLTKTSGRDLKKMADVYKQMYSITLNVKKITDVKVLAEHLSNILQKISQLNKNQK